MRLGFNEATAMKKSSLQKDVELCERYGYDYIEIRLDMLKDYLKDHTVEDLRRFFQNSHLRPYAFNSIENINFCTESEWEERLELFTFGCEMAREINNPYIIVVPTMGEDMAQKSEQEVFEDSVKVLTKLSDIAKLYNVKLAFEPIGDPRWCVRSLRQCWDIVRTVDRENVGIALDAFNLFMFDKLNDIEDIGLIPIEKIFVYHIDDSEDLPLKSLDHCHRVFPGDGIIPLKEVSIKLKTAGYDEIASLELFRPEYWDMDPEDVIRIGAEKTKAYL
jgi:2-keto-myo-inositol isomerase